MKNIRSGIRCLPVAYGDCSFPPRLVFGLYSYVANACRVNNMDTYEDATQAAQSDAPIVLRFSLCYKPLRFCPHAIVLWITGACNNGSRDSLGYRGAAFGIPGG